MAEIPHYNISIDASEIEYGAEEIIKLLKPEWDQDLQVLKFQHFTAGLSNRLVGVYQPDNKDDMVLVRVFGEKTELMVDREAEKATFIFLSEAGYSPPLYCTFKNGMAYGFVKGIPLDGEMVRDKNIRTLIAKEMAKLHSLKKGDHSRGDNSNLKPGIFSKMEEFLTLTPEGFSDEEKQKQFSHELKSKAALQAERVKLKTVLQALTSDVVFCHNDLLLQNIVFDSESNKVGFIDYEFAFHNLQAFDIGNHFNEYTVVDTEVDTNKYPDREYQLSWIRTYLEEYYILKGLQITPSDKDVERFYVQVNKCALASNFLWGLWALVMVEHSKIEFDYLRYGISRIKEYYHRRDEFFALEEP